MIMKSQNLREIVDELRGDVKAIGLKCAQTEQDLKKSQQKGESLAHEVAEIRERMESTQKRIGALILEGDALKRELKMRELEIEILQWRSTSTTVPIKEQVDDYKKQLESLSQQLDAEKRNMRLLQEELQKKTVELEKKLVEIQFLREGRDSANFQLKMEKERADMMSKKLAAEAISHAVHMKEVQVYIICNLMTCIFLHFTCTHYRCNWNH